MCSNAHTTALSFQRGRGWVYLHGTVLNSTATAPLEQPLAEREPKHLSRGESTPKPHCERFYLCLEDVAQDTGQRKQAARTNLGEGGRGA